MEKVKLINIAATIVVMYPALSFALGVTWESCLLFVAAILFYGLVRYFDQKEPISGSELKKIEAEVADLKTKVGYISVKVGFGRNDG